MILSILIVIATACLSAGAYEILSQLVSVPAGILICIGVAAVGLYWFVRAGIAVDLVNNYCCSFKNCDFDIDGLCGESEESDDEN